MRKKPIVAAIALAGLGVGSSGLSLAQESEGIKAPTLEEVVVVGRLQSVAASLTDERLELGYSADFLGFEAISRAGDSTIGAALRRVTGLTLVDNKFIYVRGLGERYTSVTVNGAAVPSPDLARSVIPLDLFPASIVESLKVQKSWGPDLPANFGGGAIDIRTKSVPSGPVANISIGTGINTASEDGLTFPESGSSSLPGQIKSAINRYRGDLSTSNIRDTEAKASGQAFSNQQAEQIQRDLILSLNRKVGISDGSLDPDTDVKVDLGNAWDVSRDWVVGASISGAYSEKFRNKDQIERGVGNPDLNNAKIERTARDERTTLAFLLGAEYTADHSVELSSYVITNEYEEARITQAFDNNNPPQERLPNLTYETRLEERELTLNQLTGNHRLGEWAPIKALEMLDFEWFYSDAEATTDIPNASSFKGSLDLNTNPATATIDSSATAGQFEFLELIDEMDSYGGKFELPVFVGNDELTFTAGWWASEKTREYYGYTANVGTNQTYVGIPQTVFTDANISDLNNDFDLSMGSGFGNESYVAAQKVNATYGGLDYRLGVSWRFTLGARWEEYQQAVLPVDLLDFTGVSIGQLGDQLNDPDQTFAITEDDTYFSAAATYLGNGLFGTEEYQIRFGVSETVVRPDLRELADVAYIDPELNVRVFGNPALETTQVSNFEIRGEFYYDDGDNFTVSLFYKDLDLPIEQVEGAGSDDDTVLTYLNGDSGEVMGVEFEGLVTLPAGFFLSGNVTLSDSEISITNNNEVTNSDRRLTGHSEYVMNASLGYDSPDEQHSASLLYNVSGERIFFAGTQGNDDAFEQPFHSLDLIYNWYPTQQLSMKVKVSNLLDSQREFEQKNSAGRNTVILEQEVGTSFGVSLSWKY
ncbi:TonB-dependent receptor plug domain-containing protein [Spongiibacter nanhainus]|uniref:TonB-dependent receptor plug domain-containing protein n=1 Tax=Spongiibacter nanhainus TaxID=2794344 RepID=A0A7T4QZT7_9GAMM|nr:TonB-dependent receptor [Spongiibacter nanhainus]QQD17674.1 TonB-dependent receptor plug domain-containing protein [Spongiibacter nanhainus]